MGRLRSTATASFVLFSFPDVAFCTHANSTLAAKDVNMTQLQEKRTDTRQNCQGQITLLLAHSQSRQFEAGLRNFSQQGIGFFCHQPLKPGTTIIFRASVEKYPRASAGAQVQLRSMGLAIVRWCQEGMRQGRPIHEMGAAYITPY